MLPGNIAAPTEVGYVSKEEGRKDVGEATNIVRHRELDLSIHIFVDTSCLSLSLSLCSYGWTSYSSNAGILKDVLKEQK